jgi:DNA polymerase-3 subunit delta
VVAVGSRDVDGFIARPDPGIDAVLIYGPDQGLVSERLARLLAHFADDPADPFVVSHLDEAEILRAPGRLAEEVGGLALGPGRRTVVVRGAGGAGASAIAEVLGAGRAAVLLVAAGDLRSGSALRKAFESSDGAAALPCYADDERAIVRLIDQVLAELGQTIESDARAALASRLGADRLASRGEIEKLSLFAGPGARITVADVEAVSADASQTTLDQVVDAIADGDPARLEIRLARAFESGTAPGQVMRAVLLHLQALHRIASDMALGARADEAIGRVRPPIHFQRRDGFARQLRRWREAELRRAMEVASEGERASRGDQGLAATAVARALLQIAVLARSSRN